MVELSSKFGALPGEAVDLIAFAHNNKLEVEGLSFHVGSQCTNIQNYIQALHLASSVFAEARTRGFELKLLDIGGGFPAHYDDTVPAFKSWPGRSTRSWTASFRKPDRDPRGAWSVPRGLRRHGRRADHRQGGSRREALLLRERRRLSDLQRRDFRPLPVPAEELQERSRRSSVPCSARRATPSTRSAWPSNCPTWSSGIWSTRQNIGAYSAASSTYFNGFPPAKVVHVNE